MRLTKKKRVFALFTALTVFLTSAFFVAMKTDVFGAKNKNGGTDTSYSYVDQANAKGTLVSLRGPECPDNADIVLTDEGSNAYGKTPKNQYAGWDPNDYITVPEGEDKLPEVPGTMGAKGSKENPFLIVEVVPDKQMQELTYFCGSKDAGMPFDAGQLSATMMMELRDNGGGAANLRFTNNDYLMSTNKDPNEDHFISNNITDKLKEMYGRFTVQSDYNIFSTNYDEEGKYTGTDLNHTTRLYDCTKYGSTENKGSYNFNEIYNVDITTDDLLKVSPTVRKKDAAGKNLPEDAASSYEYSKYLIALASTQKNCTSDNDRVQKLINEVLSKQVLDKRTLKSAKNYLNNNDKKTSDTAHSTAFVKYNITQEFLIDQGITPADCNAGNGDDPGFDKYNVSEGRTQRDLRKGNYHNYWKLQFRKYYVDHFEELYNAFWAYEKDHNICNERDAILAQLLQEYAPLFEDKNVSLKSTKDFMDWESTGSKDILSKVRTYQAESKGGYVLAVKPGMGDMYLVTDRDKIKQMGGDDDTIVFARDKRAASENGQTKGDDSMRWVYVPNTFALNGDHEPGNPKALSGDNAGHGRYHNGYLDDYRYTLGFASKSIHNINDMTMAIYDRKGRRFHGYSVTDKIFEGTNNIGSTGLDSYSKKMLRDTDVTETWTYWDQKLSNKIKGKDDNGRDIGRIVEVDDTIRTNSYAGTALTAFENLLGNDPADGWLDYSRTDKDNRNNYVIDDFHLNVMEQLLGKKADWSTVRRKVAGVETAEWKSIFNTNGGIIEDQYKEQEIKNILTNDDLINSGGQAWFSNSSGDNSVKVRGNALGNRWLYSKVRVGNRDVNVADSSFITGLCFNFRDVAWNADGKYVQTNPDIYDQRFLKDAMFTYNTETVKDASGQMVNIPIAPVGASGENDIPKEDGKIRRKWESNRWKNGDGVSLVDRTQKITEAVKSYHFTYYGFDTKDILKDRLFKMVGEDREEIQEKYDNLVYKVICVTPAEMNQISQKAKELNATKGVASTDEDIKLDLIERADMFYFHTHKTKSVTVTGENRNGIGEVTGMAYRLYQNVVNGTTGTAGIPDVSGMDTFFQNDLEWDSVMKLIKRSSLNHGISIPILFNGSVATMTEEGVDPGISSQRGRSVDDTLMCLYRDQSNNMQTMQYSGNVCNISKLYLVLIQFDLHAKTNVTNVKDMRMNLNGQPNPNYNTAMKDESGHKIKYVRTFMGDIFPWLKKSEINPNYTEENKSGKDYTVSNTAKYTGYVNGQNFQYDDNTKKWNWVDDTYTRADDYKLAPESDESIYSRKLWKGDKSEAFSRNTTSLWNKYTFYPADEYIEDEYSNFIRYGYLHSFYRGLEEKDYCKIFDRDSAPHEDAYKFRVGTNGRDYQNVYVLHTPGSTPESTQDSMFCCMGYDNANIQNNPTNDFLAMIYTILDNPGEPEEFELSVRPRSDHKYSLMGTTGDTDIVMLPYYKDSTKYPKTKRSEIKGMEKNILLTAVNANKTGDYAYIEEVWKQTDDKVVDTQDTDHIKLNLTDLFVDKTGSNTATINSDPYASITRIHSDDTEEDVANVSYSGIRLNGGDKKYYRLPYTMEDFFKNASGKSFDWFVIKARYLFFNKKSDKTYEYSVVKKINIREKELPMLE